MNTEKYDFLISEIGNKLNEIIPTDWDKILFYVEIQPGVISPYYCFFESASKSLVQFGDIVEKYKISDNELHIKETELDNIIEELNDEFANNNQERWTTMTFILYNDGKFDVDFGYEDLYATDELYRRKQWKKKYLNI